MKKLIFALLLLSTPVYAQSSPNLIRGQVPTAAQWNSYFAAKQDVIVAPTVTRHSSSEVTYTIQPQDCGHRLIGTNSTVAMIWTLPPNSGSMAQCTGLIISNSGTMPLFINATTSLFMPYGATAGPNGFSQTTVSPNQTVTITSDRNGAWIADILPVSKANGYEKSVYATSYSLSNGGPFFSISGTPTIGNTIGFDYIYETTPGGPGTNTLQFRYTFTTNTVAELETAANSLVNDMKNNATLVSITGPDQAQYFVAVQTAPLPTPTWLVAMNQVYPFNPNNHPHVTVVNTPGGHTVTIAQTNDAGGGAASAALDIGSWFGCTRGTIWAGRQPQAGDRICGFFVGGETTGNPINNHDYQPIYASFQITITDPTPGIAAAQMVFTAQSYIFSASTSAGLGNFQINASGLTLVANAGGGVGGVALPAGTVGTFIGADTSNGGLVTARGFGGAGASGVGGFVMQGARGTGRVPLAVINGDSIGALSFGGYNAVPGYTQSAAIVAAASETYTGAHSGSYLNFYTTITGTNSLTNIGRMENDGGLTWPPGVTGGSKGAGTINVSGGYYVNGVAISGACAVCAVTNATNTFTADQIITGSLTTSVSVISPIYVGGIGSASSLTLESTSGTGTTDSILFKTGSQVKRGTIATGGQWVVRGAATPNVQYAFDINNNAASTSSGVSAATDGTLTRFVAADGVGTNIELVSVGGSAGSVGNAFRGLYAGGTLASPTVATGVGNVLHNFLGYAHDGTAYRLSSAYQMLTTQTWSGSARGTKHLWYSTPDNSTTITLGMTLNSSGSLSIGSASDLGTPGVSAPLVLVNGALPGLLEFKLAAANFSSTADQPITISLPTGYTRYRVNSITASNPSTSMTTAAGGFYTAASKGGTAVVAAGQVYSGLTTNSPNTSGSLLFTTIVNGSTAFYNASILYFSLTTPQAGSETADISVFIQPLP